MQCHIDSETIEQPWFALCITEVRAEALGKPVESFHLKDYSDDLHYILNPNVHINYKLTRISFVLAHSLAIRIHPWAQSSPPQ